MSPRHSLISGPPGPDVLHLVPYTVGLLAQTDAGIDAMKHCERVVFPGSAAPEGQGDELVTKGVNLETFWGAIEIGSLGNSLNRARGDNSWNYIRIPPLVAKYIWRKPLKDDIYECVYLYGLEALVVTNSDNPPKSFHSKDIFVKHPKLDAWKHIGRLDDRLTLINGEKVLPVPMEGRIRQDPLTRECCTFGTGRPVPSILVFRAEYVSQLIHGRNLAYWTKRSCSSRGFLPDQQGKHCAITRRCQLPRDGQEIDQALANLSYVY